MRPRGWEVVERIRRGEVLVFDGGYGTMLFAAGLANGACPELWNDTHADVVAGIHKGYFDAGSQIVETNTFGGTRLKLNEYQLGDRTGELNLKGARLARSVAPPAAFVAGSIGPTSRLPAEYEPLGDTTDEEYVETFKEQAAALAEGGVDLFAVETMMFPQEAVAAIRACKAVTDLPVMATMFFQYEELHDRDRTMWGESPAEVAKNLLAAGADVIGMNCGRGPDRAIVIIREMRAVSDAPLVAYPNAGLPVTTGDNVTYELGPEAMARDYPALLDAGANIVGACCGSNPDHIRLISEVVRSRSARRGREASL
jgi:5-methyltetrahydrofolate--homocysteine methyltransferase